MGLQAEAKLTALHSGKAALKTVVDNVYFQSVIQGTDSIYADPRGPGITIINGIAFVTFYGYPQEVWEGKLEHLIATNFIYLGNGWADESILDTHCEHAMCIINQIQLSKINPAFAGANYWGLAIFPKGATLRSDCMALYYFNADPNFPELTRVYIEEYIDGC